MGPVGSEHLVVISGWRLFCCVALYKNYEVYSGVRNVPYGSVQAYLKHILYRSLKNYILFYSLGGGLHSLDFRSFKLCFNRIRIITLRERERMCARARVHTGCFTGKVKTFPFPQNSYVAVILYTRALYCNKYISLVQNLRFSFQWTSLMGWCAVLWYVSTDNSLTCQYRSSVIYKRALFCKIYVTWLLLLPEIDPLPNKHTNIMLWCICTVLVCVYC